MSESAEQMKVVEWCRITDWKRRESGLEAYGLELIIHIPNGGLRSKSEAARLKAMGVLPGVSDLFLPVMAMDDQGETYGGLWIEMKGEKGRVGVEQEKWIETMRRRGYRAVVAFGADEAIRAIAEYVGIRHAGTGHAGMADAP
jgi:hypothetical protein